MGNEKINYLDAIVYDPKTRRYAQRSLTKSELNKVGQNNLKIVVDNLNTRYEKVHQYKLRDRKSEADRLFYLFFNMKTGELMIKNGRHSKLSGYLQNIRGNITNISGIGSGELYGDISRLSGIFDMIKGYIDFDAYGDVSSCDGDISKHKGDFANFINNRQYATYGSQMVIPEIKEEKVPLEVFFSKIGDHFKKSFDYVTRDGYGLTFFRIIKASIIFIARLIFDLLEGIFKLLFWAIKVIVNKLKKKRNDSFKSGGENGK